MSDAAAKKEEPKKAEPAKKEGAEQAPKPKKDLLSLLIFALVTLNLAAVGGMGYFLKNLWGQMKDIQVKQIEKEETAAHEEEANPTPKTAEPKPNEMGVLYPVESFLVNITSEFGPKFLQAQMELELADASVENEIAKKKPALRDAIILLLSSRTYKELRDPAGIKKLRIDILKTVNDMLTTGKVKNLYFTQFHFN